MSISVAIWFPTVRQICVCVLSGWQALLFLPDVDASLVPDFFGTNKSTLPTEATFPLRGLRVYARSPLFLSSADSHE